MEALPCIIPVDVKHLTGKVFRMEVNLRELVGDSRVRLAKMMGIPTHLLQLVWAGKLLDYSKTWDEQGFDKTTHSPHVIEHHNRGRLISSIKHLEETIKTLVLEQSELRKHNIREAQRRGRTMNDTEFESLLQKQQRELEQHHQGIEEEILILRRWKSAAFAAGPFAAWKRAAEQTTKRQAILRRRKCARFAAGPFAAWKRVVQQAAETRQLLEQFRAEDDAARKALHQV